MKTTLALAYKEFRQVRWFLFWGLMVFLVFPLLEAFTHYRAGYSFRTDMPEGIVLCLGGFFAIFTAVGTVCPELKKELFVFWRSRPIEIWRWILTKYAVGLFVIFIVCIVPVIMELVIHSFVSPNRKQDFVYTVLNSHTFTIIAIYSLSFLIGSLVRKTTHAAILSFAMMLLIYFLPVLVPPLKGLSVINLLMRFRSPFSVEITEVGSKYIGDSIIGASKEQWGYWFGSPRWAWIKLTSQKALIFHYFAGYFSFVLTMLGISLASVVLSGRAIVRNWQIKMEQKLLCWSMGLVILLIFSTIAFSLGSNLESQKTIDLEYINREVYSDLHHDFVKTHHGLVNSVIDGKKGLCIGFKAKPQEQKYNDLYFFTFELDNETVDFSGITYLNNKSGAYVNGQKIAWSAENPEILWSLKSRKEDLDDGSIKGHIYLAGIRLNTESQSAVEISDLELGNYIGRDQYQRPSGSSFVLYKNEIHAYICNKYLRIDVKDSSNPVIVANEKYSSGFSEGKDFRMLSLIPDNNLNQQERLDITMRLLEHRLMTVEQDILISVAEDHIKVFKLKEVKGNRADFEMISYRLPTPLERVFTSWPKKIMLKNGLAYVISIAGPTRGLSVFDVSQPGIIQKIGHYKRPKDAFNNMSYINDDKIILISENRIHIIESPKTKRK